jgi:hypothetical protein
MRLIILLLFFHQTAFSQQRQNLFLKKTYAAAYIDSFFHKIDCVKLLDVSMRNKNIRDSFLDISGYLKTRKYIEFNFYSVSQFKCLVIDTYLGQVMEITSEGLWSFCYADSTLQLFIGDKKFIKFKFCNLDKVKVQSVYNDMPNILSTELILEK